MTMNDNIVSLAFMTCFSSSRVIGQLISKYPESYDSWTAGLFLPPVLRIEFGAILTIAQYDDEKNKINEHMASVIELNQITRISLV